MGRVQVPLHRLKQWEFDFTGLAKASAIALGLTKTVEEVVPGRLWSLGRLKTSTGPRPAFLARGLAWENSAAIFVGNTALKPGRRPVLFVAGALPPDTIWPDTPPEVVSLSEVLSLDTNRLVLDADAWAEIMSPVKGLAQGPKGRGRPRMSSAEEARCRTLQADWLRFKDAKAGTKKQFCKDQNITVKDLNRVLNTLRQRKRRSEDTED